MSFKELDRKTYIADLARAFGSRRISKRDFLKKMGLAGRRLLGLQRRPSGHTRGFHGNTSLFGTEAMAQGRERHPVAEGRGLQVQGHTIRYTSEATPPTVVLDKIKQEFIEPTGINVEIEIVPLEQVLAKATLSTSRASSVPTTSTTSTSPGSRPSRRTRWSRVSTTADAGSRDAGLRLGRPSRRRSSRVSRNMRASGSASVRRAHHDHDVPSGLFDKHNLRFRKTVEDFTAAAKAIFEARRPTASTAPVLQAKSGHYSLNCD